MGKTVDIKGLIRFFDSMQDQVEDEEGIIHDALEKCCLIVENDAKRNCPVDTGILRASITHYVDDEKQEGVVGTNVLYAPYVEYGTGLFAGTDPTGIGAEFKGKGRQDPWVYQRADGKWITTTGQKPQPYLNLALNSNQS